ncbi:MAG: VC2662 family protein [Aeromonas sp.]
MKLTPFALLAAALCASSAQASTAVQLSLPGVNLPSDQQVEGVRGSFIYGKTSRVEGIDLPIFALSDTQRFTGLQLGVFFGAGRVRGQFEGVAINAFNWHHGNDTGVNVAFVNLVNNVNGINLAFANLGQGNSLASVAAFNYAPRATFQLGFVNATQRLDGLQIGFVNYAANGVLPILPLVNFSKSF